MYWLVWGLIGAGCYVQQRPLEYRTLASEIVALRKDGHITCSGFWIGPNHALTAKHCLSNFDSVTDFVGRGVVVVNARGDRDSDVGLLTLQSKAAHPSATLTDRMPTPGSPVWAIGHHMGLGWWYTTGLASGVVNGQFRYTAPIMPGASGGPVFTETGSVCGVAVAVQQYPLQLIPGLFVLQPIPHMAYAVPMRKVLQFLHRSLP